MQAYRLTGWQRPPELCRVLDPEPGPGQVRVRVGGVGLCHSDLLFLDAAPGLLPYQLPFTLGHETAGWVDALGPGATGLELGTPVAVACVSACWQCRWCRRGAENYCVDAWRGRGYGLDGGLADYVVCGRREVVPLGELAPRDAAPLTDAGATSYHAVARVAPRLGPCSVAVVIGAGGLGGYAIQWLRLLTPARVVAVDTAPHRLTLAAEFGAHSCLDGGEGLSKRLRAEVGADGADAVLDFVGSDATLRAALRAAATLGAVALVGQGFGSVPVSWGALPHDCDLFIPRGSTVRELCDVVAFAASGRVRSVVEHFPFHATATAYGRLRDGSLLGRAVVEPGEPG